MLLRTSLGSFPCCTAWAEMRLFWIEFGSLKSSLGFASAAGGGMLGRSVRACWRVRTCSKVGAAAILALVSILFLGMDSQSRSVASSEV